MPYGRESIASCLLRQYGRERFAVLVAMLKDGATSDEIAQVFKVNRSTAWRWRSKMGRECRRYEVDPAVLDLLGQRASRTTRVTA